MWSPLAIASSTDRPEASHPHHSTATTRSSAASQQQQPLVFYDMLGNMVLDSSFPDQHDMDDHDDTVGSTEDFVPESLANFLQQASATLREARNSVLSPTMEMSTSNSPVLEPGTEAPVDSSAMMMGNSFDGASPPFSMTEDEEDRQLKREILHRFDSAASNAASRDSRLEIHSPVQIGYPFEHMNDQWQHSAQKGVDGQEANAKNEALYDKSDPHVTFPENLDLSMEVDGTENIDGRDLQQKSKVPSSAKRSSSKGPADAAPAVAQNGGMPERLSMNPSAKAGTPQSIVTYGEVDDASHDTPSPLSMPSATASKSKKPRPSLPVQEKSTSLRARTPTSLTPVPSPAAKPTIAAKILSTAAANPAGALRPKVATTVGPMVNRLLRPTAATAARTQSRSADRLTRPTPASMAARATRSADRISNHFSRKTPQLMRKSTGVRPSVSAVNKNMLVTIDPLTSIVTPKYTNAPVTTPTTSVVTKTRAARSAQASPLRLAVATPLLTVPSSSDPGPQVVQQIPLQVIATRRTPSSPDLPRGKQEVAWQTVEEANVNRALPGAPSSTPAVIGTTTTTSASRLFNPTFSSRANTNKSPSSLGLATSLDLSELPRSLQHVTVLGRAPHHKISVSPHHLKTASATLPSAAVQQRGHHGPPVEVVGVALLHQGVPETVSLVSKHDGLQPIESIPVDSPDILLMDRPSMTFDDEGISHPMYSGNVAHPEAINPLEQKRGGAVVPTKLDQGMTSFKERDVLNSPARPTSVPNNVVARVSAASQAHNIERQTYGTRRSPAPTVSSVVSRLMQGTASSRARVTSTTRSMSVATDNHGSRTLTIAPPSRVDSRNPANGFRRPSVSSSQVTPDEARTRARDGARRKQLYEQKAKHTANNTAPSFTWPAESNKGNASRKPTEPRTTQLTASSKQTSTNRGVARSRQAPSLAQGKGILCKELRESIKPPAPPPPPSNHQTPRPALTIPQSPKLSTSARHSAKTEKRDDLHAQKTLAEETEMYIRRLRDDRSEVSSNSGAGRAGLTIPQAPHFATSHRYGERTPATKASWCDGSSLAHSTDILAKGLRGPIAAFSSKQRHTLTRPQSPKFHELHHRGSARKEAAEIVATGSNRPVAATGTSKRQLTVPQPFQFHYKSKQEKSSRNMAADRNTKTAPARPTPQEIAGLEEMKKQFKARPRPDLKWPTKHKDELELLLQDEPVEAFKARPVPPTTYQAPPQRAPSVSPPSRLTSPTKGPTLTTSSRPERRSAATEASRRNAEALALQKEMEAKRRQREKHRQVMLQSADSKSSVLSPADKIKPFHLRTDERHQRYQQQLEEKIREEEAERRRLMEFHAQGYLPPPPPEEVRYERKFTEPVPFQLNGVERQEASWESKHDRLREEEEERRRQAYFKANPVPKSTYSHKPISPLEKPLSAFTPRSKRGSVSASSDEAPSTEFKARSAPKTTYVFSPISSFEGPLSSTAVATRRQVRTSRGSLSSLNLETRDSANE